MDTHHDTFQLLPEWVKQDGVMLTWPHREMIWADTLSSIDQVFVEVSAIICQHEKLLITCFDEAHQEHIKTLLTNAHVNLNQVRLFISAADDVWVRDHGPLGVVNKDGKMILLDFIFNGWGNKYPADNDNLITQNLYTQKAFNQTPLRTINMVLEGGAIEVDGQGTLLTTTSCLLSQTRNPSLSQNEISHHIKELLGIKRILWLEHGYLAGDDTDGHIDTLARFVDPHTICYIRCDDESDEHFPALKAMEKQLQSFTDYQGNPYKLIPLPWPKARFADYDGRRLPATYANFLIINGAVLVPTYDDPADQKALNIIAELFPDRQIEPIHSLPVIQWYGSLHCMTMQLPQGVLS